MDPFGHFDTSYAQTVIWKYCQVRWVEWLPLSEQSLRASPLNANLVSSLRIMLRQWEETRSIANQLLDSGDHTLLVDFDSHLDDITKDWTNQKLNAKIAELASPVNGNVWFDFMDGCVGMDIK